jgi:hypothetical protein
MGEPSVGGGKETRIVAPAQGKFRILHQMPDRVGGSAVYGTTGDKFQIFGYFVEGIAFKFPAKQFIESAGGRNSLQKLGYINTHPRNTAVAGEGVYSYPHITSEKSWTYSIADERTRGNT